ncbi:MAG: cellulase family glycosylhydrolase [Lachnospiraceae bacterium]|nr:cellulase family glycosylhydrolase [Lachnospiraceae bacterium]
METIRGTNLGNWLVLEKWMKPDLFEGCEAEDETYLARKMPAGQFKALLKEHRESYISEKDFQTIRDFGLNIVRLPLPYHVFGGRPPLVSCIEYVDKAMDWAEQYGLKVLLNLHTVPGSQNGYDKGGLTGVCKWRENPEEVEYALTVLERLAKRYGTRKGLFGIEVLNEPISFIVCKTVPLTGKTADKEEAKGSGYVPLSFLKKFYKEAYRRLRAILPEDKTIVFHDGFRLMSWNHFFKKNGFQNTMLDTHFYIFSMENFVPFASPRIYQIYLAVCRWRIRHVQKAVPLIVGEWCICNKYADRMGDSVMGLREYRVRQRKKYRLIAKMELKSFAEARGWFYWNYQLLRDREAAMDQSWKESWDLCRCMRHGWITKKMIADIR